MHAHGLQLINPDSEGVNDDGIVVYNGEKIGIEATFTSWGAPGDPLGSTYRAMARGGANLDNLDVDITDQIGKALAGKEHKLAARQPNLTRIVTLNEVLVTAEFPGLDGDVEGRRSKIGKILRTQNPVGITCITYDYIGYGNFFSDPKLTLMTMGGNINKYAGLASLLRS